MHLVVTTLVALNPFASIHLDRKALSDRGTPIDSIIRSYQGESTGSHPNSEVKHPWACSVLRWGTTWESQVMYVFASEGLGFPINDPGHPLG